MRDVVPGPTPSLPAFLGVTNGVLMFVAEDGVHGREMWRSDGTTAGTTFFHDATPCSGDLSARLMADARGTTTLLFTTLSQVWRSDGTSPGTSLVADLEPGTQGSSPGPLSWTGSVLLFPASTSAAGTELWISDGTAAGTVHRRR